MKIARKTSMIHCYVIMSLFSTCTIYHIHFIFVLIPIFYFQFLCFKNIGIFLQTCEHKFGLHTDDLFEPEMLFESLDFKRVS